MAEKKRYPVDSAGTLYAALQSDTYSPIYRITAVLDAPVDKAAYQRAIDKTMPRFPGLNVRLRRGLFWNYFEEDDKDDLKVRPDVRNCCQPVKTGGANRRLLRFFAYGDRLSIECYHALCDGAGAMVFFKTLLAVYFRELGVDVPNGEGVLDVTQPPREEETEDAYSRYARGRSAHDGWLETAYHPKGTREPFYTLNITQGLLSVAQLKEKARSYGASITAYLAAALMWTLLERQRREAPAWKRPVALAVPVDLRRHFPSDTLRTFIITARLVAPGGVELAFSQVLELVKEQLRRETAPQTLQGKINGNVGFRNNPAFQLIPTAVKDPGIRLAYWAFGVRPYSVAYTNPGPFTVPPEMAAHIRRVEATLGQTYDDTENCTSISFGDVMSISFAGSIAEREVEQDFFRFLSQEGLTVEVSTNRPEHQPQPPASPAPYPTLSTPLDRPDRRRGTLVRSGVLALLAALCLLANALLTPQRLWSLWAVGACVCLWTWSVLPKLLPRGAWMRILATGAAVSLWLWLISLDVGGGWYLPVALPIVLTGTALLLALCFLLPGRPTQQGVTNLLAGLALYCLAIEFFADRWAAGRWTPGWSLWVAGACAVGAAVMAAWWRRAYKR